MPSLNSLVVQVYSSLEFRQARSDSCSSFTSPSRLLLLLPFSLSLSLDSLKITEKHKSQKEILPGTIKMFCFCRSTKLFFSPFSKKEKKKKILDSFFSMASIVSTAVEHPNVYDGTKRTGMWSGSRKVHDVIKKYQAFLMLVRSLLHVSLLTSAEPNDSNEPRREPARRLLRTALL
jgi:hypothetical protein